MNFPEDFCNSSIKRGKRVFRTRLPGGRRLFVTYQWGKPQPGTQPFTKPSKNLVHHKVTQLLDNLSSLGIECRECGGGQCPPQISQ